MSQPMSRANTLSVREAGHASASDRSGDGPCQGNVSVMATGEELEEQAVLTACQRIGAFHALR
jgi:hypothetical protein